MNATAPLSESRELRSGLRFCVPTTWGIHLFVHSIAPHSQEALTKDLKGSKGIDPQMRERLLRESQTPWRGLRRVLWFALFASAGLGLFTMLFRASAGVSVNLADIGIQTGALVLFAALLWFDRTTSGGD